ncbi:MAG: tape measure protein [Chromatiaceae bacterium]|nr:tape measure protein [Candidatus Thioaporhodococcus sediminis]
MADTRNSILQLLITAKDQASSVLTNVRAGLTGIGDAASSAMASLRTFGGLLGAAVGIGGSREILELAEAFTRLQNNLKTVTSSQEELADATALIGDIAKRTNADIETTAALYTRIGVAGKSLGISQEQTARLTELISKGMQLGGASAQEYASATLQLSQAFNSGVLRGEEFNAVMEAAPGLMNQIARGLGVATGELRKLAEAGSLSASAVSIALLSQGDAIDELYGKLTTTVAQGWSQLRNEAILFTGQLDIQTGATRTLGEGLQFLAQNLDVVAAAFGAGAAAAIAKFTASTAAYVQQAALARKAAADQAIAEAAKQRALEAGLKAQVAAAQANYNLALAEQRRVQALLLAIESTFGAVRGEEALNAARIQASAAAQTATAALQRYTAAQAALAAGAAPAAASVGLLSRAMGFLAGPGGLILTAVATFGLLFTSFRDTKAPADALTQSIDDFSAALDRMNRAQLQAQNLELTKALELQEWALRRARFEAREYNETVSTTGEVTRTARAGTEEYILAQAALAVEEEKTRAIQERRQLVVAALGSAQANLSAEEVKAAGAMAQMAFQLEQTIGKLGERASAVKAVADAEIAETQALLERAEAQNNVQAAEQLSIKLAQQRADQARQAATLDNAEAESARAKVARLEALQAIQGRLTAAQQKDLDQIRESVRLKGAEAEASAALARKLEVEADALREGGAARQTNLEQTRRIADAGRDYTASLEAIAEAQLNGLRAERDLAIAKGQTATAQQKSRELAELEVRWSQTLAAAKQAELQAELASQQAKLAARQAVEVKTAADQAEINAIQLKIQALQLEIQLQAQKQGVLAQQQQTVQNTTQTTKDNTSATQQNTQTQQQNTEATQDAKAAGGGLGEVLASQINFWREHTAALSESTRALFEYNAGLSSVDPQYARDLTGAVSEGAAAAAQKINDLTAGIQGTVNILTTTTASDVGRLFGDINIAGAKAEKTFYEQKLVAESLLARLEEVGETGGRSFANIDAALGFVNRSALTTVDSLYLLDDQTLDGLRGAIDDANDKLREMQQITQDARDRLTELNAELLEARGMDEKAEALRQNLEYAQDRAEIEAQMAEARAAGNTELVGILQQQLSVLDDINRTKLANIRADEQAARRETATADNLNKISAAADKAATQVERVSNATRLLSGIDLSRLQGQTNALAGDFGAINSLL